MVLRLIIKNFLSFDDEVQFDMFPNLKKTNLNSHIYQGGDVPLLKQAAVYGANGAGKSNLVKAFEFVKDFAIYKGFLKGIDLHKNFYLLKENSAKEPINIGIEFKAQSKYFFYEIEIGVDSIIRESLFETFPLEERMELVFERKGRTIEFARASDSINGVIKNAVEKVLAKNSMSSVLALNREFPMVEDNRCNFAYKWFKSQLEIIGINSYIPALIDLLRNDEQMMEFVKEYVPSLEVGLKTFNVEESDFDEWAKNHINLANMVSGDLKQGKSLYFSTDKGPVFSFNIEDGIRKVYQLLFENIGRNSYVAKFDSNSQSDGTLRAFSLLPALYFAAKKGKTVVVDEINCCLSPTMVKGLVGFFARNNETNGQLIFTTHDIMLLDEKDILRSDEIWFVDKIDGTSILYSHNDFKEHHTISTLRGYNEGRYGAIRFINLQQKDDEKQACVGV